MSEKIINRINSIIAVISRYDFALVEVTSADLENLDKKQAEKISACLDAGLCVVYNAEDEKNGIEKYRLLDSFKLNNLQDALADYYREVYDYLVYILDAYKDCYLSASEEVQKEIEKEVENVFSTLEED